MPKIHLKPNSPEFIDRRPQARAAGKHCAMPGCTRMGEHRAPKDRSLSDYHWFCLEHVQEYNAAWDFFSGMQERDIEDHIIESLYGDRPTWRSDAYRGLEAELQAKIHQARFFTPDEDIKPKHRQTGNPELDALAILDLTPPVTFDAIKTRYRMLVKKYHPDQNQQSADEQDLIKHINMAYTILKMIYRSTP